MVSKYQRRGEDPQNPPLGPTLGPSANGRRSSVEACNTTLSRAVRLVAAGHEPALKMIYDATVARVFGVARGILRDSALAEEAVADTYAQLWRDAHTFDVERASVERWLSMIARSRAIDLRRRFGSGARLADPRGADAPLGDEATAAAASPASHADEHERKQLVHEALASLPSEQRVALEAAFFGGLTHAEVASQLDVPLGTVKSRIRAGLSTLRPALSRWDAEWT